LCVFFFHFWGPPPFLCFFHLSWFFFYLSCFFFTPFFLPLFFEILGAQGPENIKKKGEKRGNFLFFSPYILIIFNKILLMCRERNRKCFSWVFCFFSKYRGPPPPIFRKKKGGALLKKRVKKQAVEGPPFLNCGGAQKKKPNLWRKKL